MKNAFAIAVAAALALTNCGKKSEDHSEHHPQEGSVSADPNKALSDSVMDVHNEVMPKMGEIIRLTETLRDKIAKTPDLPAAKKQELETTIDSLDRASDSMMDWMHKYKPESHSGDQAREYLKSEMVRVTAVKERMLAAIEKAKSLQ